MEYETKTLLTMKDYFSHDYNARNDKKLTKLFMKHGLSGIGAYWCIIEMLYEEGGYLNLEDAERITFELRCKNELVDFIIHDSELFQNDGEKFWSETAIERLKLRSEKSQKAKDIINYRWEKHNKTNESREVKNELPQLYVIFCYNENEQFIKVGITEASISRRYSGKIPYRYKVLYQYFSPEYIFMESALNNELINCRYLPKINFGGINECYNIESINIIEEFNPNAIKIEKNEDNINDVKRRISDVIHRNTSKVKESKENNIVNAKAFLSQKIKELYPEPNEFEKIELNKFYSYWTEQNKSGTKVKYQMEKTWDLTKRINRWFDNAEKGFKK